eukprot:7203-Eustigmatos_ZCMA.PRE.1
MPYAETYAEPFSCPRSTPHEAVFWTVTHMHRVEGPSSAPVSLTEVDLRLRELEHLEATEQQHASGETQPLGHLSEYLRDYH